MRENQNNWSEPTRWYIRNTYTRVPLSLAKSEADMD